MDDGYYGVNLGQYGAGIIKGLALRLSVNADRPKHVEGPLTLDDMTFTAASGSKRAYGCPYGTYILTPQATGSIIKRHYQHQRIHGPHFGKVWNVGRPKSITAVGFDPGAGRGRRAIQIHCSRPPLKSSGCVVMDLDDFQAFAKMMAGKDDMVLEVAPSENEGAVEFRVFPKQDW